MKIILTLVVSILSLFANAQSKSVYQWLNVPCVDLLNCNTGCSACNLSSNSDQYFQGISADWVGISYCPHPVSSGDNAVGTYGWGMTTDTSKFILISFTNTVPVVIDSLIMKSARSSFGPDKCLISMSINGSPFQVAFDGNISHYFESSFASNLGLVGTNGTSGSLRVKIQPYGSDEGMWFLDEIKVVVSPDISTGILTFPSPSDQYLYEQINYPYIDLLGRETNSNPSGIYIKRRKKN